MLTSVMFLYGVLTWIYAHFTHQPWAMTVLTRHTSTLVLMGSTTTLQFVHLGVRAWCTSRIYGWRFASGVPIRAMLANYINCRATLGAISRFAKSKITKSPLVWLKTDHSYPVFDTPAPIARKLGEILVSTSGISNAQLLWALETKPQSLRLGEYLVRTGLTSEEQIYRALSLQSNLPFFRLEPARVKRSTARALPLHTIDSCHALPFQITGGYLFLAVTELPTPQSEAELTRCTRLQRRLQLVTPSNFNQLRQALLE
jgi:hypothetical protein